GTVNLQVTSDYGNKYIVTQTVSVPGTYTLNFSLKTEEQYVEFRGFAVNGNVQLVKIKVTGGPS
ncbi:MAG: hypothetical protein JRN01_05630, partial [Nitrososphaerota archaeon]|nr:hypothetical protein [Nitrososphaerota archaeon]